MSTPFNTLYDLAQQRDTAINRAAFSQQSTGNSQTGIARTLARLMRTIADRIDPAQGFSAAEQLISEKLTPLPLLKPGFDACQSGTICEPLGAVRLRYLVKQTER